MSDARNTDPTLGELAGRIARLEAESDIRRLKARYLNACDAKDVDRIRECFTPDAELVFQLPLEQRWQGAASRIGVDLFRLTDYSGHV